MTWLVDTNILLRSIEPESHSGQTAAHCVNLLLERGEKLFLAAQNLIEFWAAATRSKQKNGYGLPIESVDRLIRGLESRFPVLPESPEIYVSWRKLVKLYGIQGVEAFDTRLVAVMIAYRVDHILTFNVRDFKKYREVTAIHPNNLQN